jgi:hypothetical protein
MYACIAEVIQRDILKGKGKAKKTMTEHDWTNYIDAKPALKACLDAHCARMGDYGDALTHIYRTLSGRIHGGRNATELELSRDYVVVSQEWLTREQVLCVACLLTQESYDFKLEPPIPGFGIQDEES